jgi:hypothetical protein
MNRSNFNQTGGFPLKTERLQELETAYSIFNSLGYIAGDLTIISGCEIEGTIIKDGRVFINGELLDFRESYVAEDSTVIIVEENVNRPFENGTVKTVQTIRYATFGIAETSWLWSSFIRPPQTKTLKAFQDTVNSKLTTIEAKLATIAEGAEVNVQSDWNVTDTNSDAFIKNKIVLSSPFLRVSSYNVGNPATDQRYVISFPTVGTSNYLVLGALKVNNASDWNASNDLIWTYGAPAATSFELYIRELENQVQSVTFVYALIPF